MNDVPGSSRRSSRRRKRGVAIALLLVALGSAATLALQMAWVPVWVPGVALLGWGAGRGAARPIVAGGILTGAGLAITVQTGPWALAMPDAARSALFLLCFALGWFLIPLVTGLATGHWVGWPLLPGLVMAISGGALWLSNGRAAALTSLVGPIVFVGIGLFLIVRWNRKK